MDDYLRQSLYQQIDYWRQRAEKLEAAARWIPVEERLPADNTMVLVWTADNDCAVALWIAELGFCDPDNADRLGVDAIAWRPLPEGPDNSTT